MYTDSINYEVSIGSNIAKPIVVIRIIVCGILLTSIKIQYECLRELTNKSFVN